MAIHTQPKQTADNVENLLQKIAETGQAENKRKEGYKMSYKNLKKALSEQPGLYRQKVEYRAKKIRQGEPMSMDEAYGVLAYQANMDMQKYLDTAEIKRIREIIYIMKQKEILGLPETQKRLKASLPKTINVTIGKDLQLSDPILPVQVIRDAKVMTELYARLYVFENSLREVIKRRLGKKYEDNWWDTFYSSNNKIEKIRQAAKGLMQIESQNAWHGRRGSHPIYYTDLSHLKTILQEGWSDFHDLFPNQNWVMTRIDELSTLRNIIDHHNPLGVDDQKLVKMYCDHWFKQIDSKKNDLA